MKKYILLVFVFGVFGSSKIQAQTINIYNSSFEIWDSLATITVPDSWPSSDLLWYFEGYNTRNVYPDTHSHSGKYSARIGPDTAGGKIWPGFIATKIHVTQRVKYLGMYYIDSINSAESGTVQITLLKRNTTTRSEDSIGGAAWDFPDSAISNFTYSEIPLVYSDSTQVPDSVSVTIEVVSVATALPSGYVAVDDVSLTAQHSADINAPVISNEFGVFPNPSNGLFHIVSPNSNNRECLLEVSDIEGEIIYTTYLDASHPNQIDLSKNPPGIYFMKILSDNQVAVNKIVINH